MHHYITDAVGTIGVIIVLVVYLLLQSHKMRFDGFAYSFYNLIGSLMIIVSLLRTFNFASFVIEIAWTLISCYGIYRYSVRKKQQQGERNG